MSSARSGRWVTAGESPTPARIAGARDPPVTGSGQAHLVERGVVEPEVVTDLVTEGDPHLVAQLRLVAAVALDDPLEEDDLLEPLRLAPHGARTATAAVH